MSLSRLLLVLILPIVALFSSSIGRGFTEVPSRGVLLVANKGDQTLGIVDIVSGQQVTTVPEGGVTGHEVIASPDGRLAYVPIYGNSGVGKPGTDGTNMVVIDIAARKVVGNLDFGKGVRPHCAVFGPKDGLLYITTEIENSITVIDPRTLKVVGSVPTGQVQSHMLAISSDGRRGYTANVGPGTVSVLDLKERKTTAIIPISATTQRISLSVDDRLVFTSDQTKPQLAVIDTSTNRIRNWVALPGMGYGSAATPDGRFLVIAMPTINKVGVIDLKTMKVAHEIEVPSAPQEVVVRPDGQEAYVSCDVSGKIAVINLATWKVDKLITAGKGADGLAWAPIR
ncbi:MAG: cytochrome D1 domain-containing protein [Acidobacteriota bacterium]